MNLSTARASIRSKEVGIKKTLGSSRKQLIFQFVTESLLIAFLAFGVAVLFLSAFLPQFNVITGKQLEFTPSLYSLGSMLGITLFTGLCSSIYPAFYLSGFAPVKVLKGKLKASFGELWVRKGLVVFQFTMSVILIASVIVIYQQMQFIHTRNLGLAKDNILTIKNEGELRDHIENFLAEVKTLPTVKNASNASTNIINNQSWTTGSNWEGKKEDVVISVFIINHDFLNTYGIRIKEGRDFSPEFGAENTRVILNEAAVKSIGYENPVGRTMTFWGQEVEIVGVTENFHFQSLFNEVKPCIFKAFKEGQNYGDIISVKIQAGKEKEAIAAIGEVYQKFNPDTPFEYRFVDQDFQHLYETENRTATLSKYFAGLAIFISCLGLFGLTTFTIERRTKEIGIRKILGASGWRITRLLSSDFMRMVLIAV
ncbi:MAG: ABC transporter permease, partial [Bacteroidetes bacterium]|nr:ABC transporter permease [Bacteroidota bacterium]